MLLINSVKFKKPNHRPKRRNPWPNFPKSRLWTRKSKRFFSVAIPAKTSPMFSGFPGSAWPPSRAPCSRSDGIRTNGQASRPSITPPLAEGKNKNTTTNQPLKRKLRRFFYLFFIYLTIYFKDDKKKVTKFERRAYYAKGNHYPLFRAEHSTAI